MRATTSLAKEAWGAAEEGQKHQHDTQGQLRVFAPGQRVLLLLPTLDNKFQVKWQGLYAITWRGGGGHRL